MVKCLKAKLRGVQNSPHNLYDPLNNLDHENCNENNDSENSTNNLLALLPNLEQDNDVIVTHPIKTELAIEYFTPMDESILNTNMNNNNTNEYLQHKNELKEKHQSRKRKRNNKNNKKRNVNKNINANLDININNNNNNNNINDKYE